MPNVKHGGAIAAQRAYRSAQELITQSRCTFRVCTRMRRRLKLRIILILAFNRYLHRASDDKERTAGSQHAGVYCKAMRNDCGPVQNDSYQTCTSP